MILDVFFDYACPYCYLGHYHLLEQLENRPDIAVRWNPCEAHPRPEPRYTVDPEATGWWRGLLPRAREAGLVLNTPRNPLPHSDLAIQGMFCVEAERGNLMEYHRNVYDAMFAQGANLEDPEVLVGCARDLVDPDRFRDALRQGVFAERQRAANDHAFRQSGVWAVPSYRYGERRFDSADGVGVTPGDLARLLGD